MELPREEKNKDLHHSLVQPPVNKTKRPTQAVLSPYVQGTISQDSFFYALKATAACDPVPELSVNPSNNVYT